MKPGALHPNPDFDTICACIHRMSLARADEHIALTPLSGGVSSDIYRADLPGRTICVKRALPRLRVAADWQAPLERNHFEVEWMQVAGGIVPSAVPRILGEDREMGCFAMAYLAPDDHPEWKALLRDGTIDTNVGTQVGRVLGLIHAATANRLDIAARFSTDAIFYAIRLEPYLVATGRVHAELMPQLEVLLQTTRTNKRVLVHGDFSPKNLLIGPRGPVIVDAECAWYGDPAFDLAFVLNHLLLKGMWRPAWRAIYAQAFEALTRAYLAQVTWESPSTVEARAAALLPALMLARIDGKSPVEYLTAAAEKDEVRSFARALVVEPIATLSSISRRWIAAGATSPK